MTKARTLADNYAADINQVTADAPLTGGGTSGTVTVGIQAGTTAQSGAVQLTDSTASTSVTTAATPNSVKSAYDLANGAIAKTLIDAKGDLIVGSAADTPSILSASTEQGSTLVADSAASTGLRWQGSAVGKNAAINGACEIAQRGTAAVTLTAAAFRYPVDRWFTGRSSGTTGATAQQITSTGLDGFQYAIRVQRTASDSTTNDLYIGQSFESANSIPFANKTVVVSFWARAGANYSPTSSQLKIRFYTGTGTDQAGLGSGFTGSATPISQTATLTTSWQRFQYSVTLASTATQMQFLAFATPTGTAGAADYYDITGLQVELGSVATPFSRAGGTIQGELAACQRYLPSIGGSFVSVFGYSYSTTGSLVNIEFPVTARVKPTGITLSSTAHFTLYNGSTASGSPTAIAYDGGSSVSNGMLLITTTAGSPTLTAGQGALLQANTASGLILWTGCEL